MGLVRALVGDPDQVGGAIQFVGQNMGDLLLGWDMRLNNWWGIRIWLEENRISVWDSRESTRVP